jgi:hypothetical protein
MQFYNLYCKKCLFVLIWLIAANCVFFLYLYYLVKITNEMNDVLEIYHKFTYFYLNKNRQQTNKMINYNQSISVINRTINIPFDQINPDSAIYLDEYNFHYCRIDKTMSTVMQVMFWTLKNISILLS